MSALLVLMLLSQADGAHEALDALDGLRLPTNAAVAASQTPERAASLGFDATQVRLIERGALDATLRLGAVLAVGSALVSGSSVGTSLSPSPWLVGATTGAVTLGVVSLLHFLWGARGGSDVFRAFELRNDARVTDAQARWAEPGLARVTERLLLLGRGGIPIGPGRAGARSTTTRSRRCSRVTMSRWFRTSSVIGRWWPVRRCFSSARSYPLAWRRSSWRRRAQRSSRSWPSRWAACCCRSG